MSELMASPSFVWFLIGFGFLLAELAMPGFIIIFFGMGAWVAALAAWLFGVGLSWQIAIFLVASILFVVILRRVWMRAFHGISGGNVDEEKLDRPENVGAMAEVVKPIGPSLPGEIKYRGTYWRAVADMEFKKGDTVVIIEEFTHDRSTFKVGPYNT